MKLTASLFFVFFFSVGLMAQQKYQLKEIRTEASCAYFALTDSNNAVVKVPPTVQNGLDCPTLLHLTGDTLVYRSANSVRVYRISTGEDVRLFDVFDDIDGVSGPVWSPSHRRMGFVMINQEQNHGYRETCRILILDMADAFSVAKKHKFDRPVNYGCYSICASSPEKDFRFVDENNFEYTRNINIDERPGEKGYILIDTTK